VKRSTRSSVRRSAPTRPSVSSASNHEKQQENENEAKKQAAEEAYKTWLAKKKRFVVKRYSPDISQSQNRELKWYENKKRMFKPDDLEPKYKPRPVQQQRQIQETVHRPKPRVYQGNGVSFEEWIKSKKLPPKQTDETEKEAEKRKANELRALMAEEKFKEWLAEKVRKQREETRTEEQQFQQDQKKETGVTFDQWLTNKQKNERTLRRLIKKMRKDEDNSSGEKQKRNMTFEDWMIRKEEEEIEKWRKDRELAKKRRESEKSKRQQIETTKIEQTSLPVVEHHHHESHDTVVSCPTPPPENQLPETDPEPIRSEKDQPRVSPDQSKVDQSAPEITPPTPSPSPPPFDANNPFVSDEESWSEHSSLADDMEDSELLKLIDHLDSD